MSERTKFAAKKALLSASFMVLFFWIWNEIISKQHKKEYEFYVVSFIAFLSVYFLLSYFYEWKHKK